jgi:hypothetical protein
MVLLWSFNNASEVPVRSLDHSLDQFGVELWFKYCDH